MLYFYYIISVSVYEITIFFLSVIHIFFADNFKINYFHAIFGNYDKHYLLTGKNCLKLNTYMILSKV